MVLLYELASVTDTTGWIQLQIFSQLCINSYSTVRS